MRLENSGHFGQGLCTQVVASYAIGFIYIPGNPCFVSFITVLMVCANNWVHYGLMVVLVCLHIKLPDYHHYADVSESIELFKLLVRYILSSAYLKFIFSCYIWGCALLAYPCLIWVCENMCSLFYKYHQIGRMNHLPFSRVKSWINDMRCMSVYVRKNVLLRSNTLYASHISIRLQSMHN